MQVYTGNFSWATGAGEVLGVCFSLASLIEQFRITFVWPNFGSIFLLQLQFAMGKKQLLTILICGKMFDLKVFVL